MSNSLLNFKDAMRSLGLEPPELIEAGKIQRFPGVGKKPSNRAGWCLLFLDRRGGCFGDWSSGIFETWQAKQDKFYSHSEKKIFSRQLANAKVQLMEEQKIVHAEAAFRAKRIWDLATIAPNHYPYLVRKSISACGAKLHNNILVLPITDISGKLTSLQFIDQDGNKRLLSGGRKQGCFMIVAGNINSSAKIVICEGWATGCSLADDEPDACVLAAIDAGNLKEVALIVRHHRLDVQLVIAGDDDRLNPSNPGSQYALNAAIATNALLAFPQWPEDAPTHLSDFNDLATWLARR